ncbi:MAG TPA: potassium channel protein [Dehalococcoidia bacterium]|nr:potassium channel protein [Dehalococcoidia bacterium]
MNRRSGTILDARTRVLSGVAVFGALIAAGTVGYMTIERWSLLDALFMTVTTVTTVGYREVRPLDTEGRIFTIFLVLFGVGTAFYLLTTFVALVIEGDLGAAFGVTRMKGRIQQLSDHHILCGFGRVGEEIAREFRERGEPFVVVDHNTDALQRAVDQGFLVIEGDAASDDVLLEAGVRRARTLLAASDSDSGNTYITLTAKALNPKVFVVARAGKPESEARALRAGADRVISPYSIGGRRMALSAIQPNIVEFMDTLSVGRTAGQILAEIEITTGSRLFGLYVRHLLEDSRVTVLGLRRASGELIVGPREDVRLEEGDRLIVSGPESEVTALSGAPEGGQVARP